MNDPLPPHTDLLDLALGRLDPPRREALERAVRRDPDLAARLAAVRTHLARWEGLPPAPPPPPFAAVAARLPTRPARARIASLRPHPALAAALGLVLVGLAIWVLAPQMARTTPLGTAGASVVIWRDGAARGPAERALRPGDVLRWARPDEVLLGPRVRIVADGDSEIRIASSGAVALRRGRACFEVAPGPFAVDTAHGRVDVVGTAFEVDVSGDALRVTVADGLVHVGPVEVAAGEGYADGRTAAAAGPIGAWFRDPELRLSGPARVAAGDVVALDVLFVNTTALPQTLAAPADTERGLRLEITAPDGRVHDLTLALPESLADRTGQDGVLSVPPGSARAGSIRLTTPFSTPGPYRCRAMYRPEGSAPLLSPDALIEVTE